MNETKCRICHGFGDAYENRSVEPRKDDFVKASCPSCNGFGYYPKPKLPVEDERSKRIRDIVEKNEQQFLSRHNLNRSI